MSNFFPCLQLPIVHCIIICALFTYFIATNQGKNGKDVKKLPRFLQTIPLDMFLISDNLWYEKSSNDAKAMLTMYK